MTATHAPEREEEEEPFEEMYRTGNEVVNGTFAELVLLVISLGDANAALGVSVGVVWAETVDLVVDTSGIETEKEGSMTRRDAAGTIIWTGDNLVEVVVWLLLVIMTGKGRGVLLVIMSFAVVVVVIVVVEVVEVKEMTVDRDSVLVLADTSVASEVAVKVVEETSALFIVSSFYS